MKTNIVSNLKELGYHWNYTSEYLYKTIFKDFLGIRQEATCFYQGGKFEYVGSYNLIKELKEEISQI